MVFIKKISMEGFKSFAKKTDIPFDQGINVILGPNGSGKSNISDALCFVLGRLSIKSMRAAKAKNLLFMGSKFVKPAKEASVELAFDNSDRTFALNMDEIKIKRAVRRNGQSIYKINDETKTRAEVIELLAHAGIDPHGFNLILQGQIQSIVRMHPEDRRKIVEEVAGISVYESRKEKSLRELEKTEDRLKEINAVLREKTSFLRNLEQEKSQAMKFKELEATVKKCKATIIHKKSEEKNKEIDKVVKSILEREKEREGIKEKCANISEEIESLTEKINQINKHIQRATGVEQETLHNQIANFKAEAEGLRVRKESYENRKSEVERRVGEIKKNIPELEKEIKELREKSPLMAKKAQELKKKKDELAVIEDERKRVLTFKTELNSLKERVKDRERQCARASAESDALLKQIESDSSALSYRDEKECSGIVSSMTEEAVKLKRAVEQIGEREVANVKIVSISESDIKNAEKIKADVGNIDICPLCQSRITEEHINHVCQSSEKKISEAQVQLNEASAEIEKIKAEKASLIEKIRNFEEKILNAGTELAVHQRIKERKEQLKKFVEEENFLKKEIFALEEKRKELETKTTDVSSIEERYDSKKMEIEEISLRTEENVDNTILYKERDIENLRNIVKRSSKDIEDLDLEISELSESLENKINSLGEKEVQERELNEEFKKMFSDRDSLQKEIQEKNLLLSERQSDVRQIEDQSNYLKIGKARLDAEAESLGIEFSEFSGVELLQGSINALEERLQKSQQALMQIGSINMRALEVYDEIKAGYDEVRTKAETIDKEKLDILSIIEEIDRKKKKEFMKTFRAINELFTTNFSALYTKGVAYLEIENQEDIFAGGVNIVVKLAKGKYFDVSSLSGGEQTLVALSLLFAIQEHKPYHFYIFDEIDAALDKRNSERLAGLLKRYMKSGQYIVVTHNDAIITESDVLYGVSMHEGISKVLSLNIKDDKNAVNNPAPQDLIDSTDSLKSSDENVPVGVV